MKKLLKKNQVIITALALMIAIAGYLQFAKNAADNEEEKYAGADINEDVIQYYGDISDEDENSDSEIAKRQMEELLLSENEAVRVSDNGELIIETEHIGEAIMVSTILDSSFSTNARLVREQTRAKSKETLMMIISNTEVSDAQKEEAISVLISLTDIAEKENAAELLLEAKGFADAVVNIVEQEVDVVINASSVTDRQIAQIEDIVTRKTGFTPEQIVITAAILSE